MADPLGVLLRRLRRQAGLTQEEAAERSGVSVRTIRRLETGTSADHRVGTVNLLADALGIGLEDRRTLAAILTKAQNATASPPPPGADPDPEPGEWAVKSPGRAHEPPAAHSFPTPGPPLPVHDVLAVAAQELAREVSRSWRHEEEQRQVHDPYPLPVRWQQAPAHLVDRWENIRRLGPGAVSPPLDLSGDVRSVAEVYQRIPSGRLVILGQAGSGKSILTIRFVLDHLEHPGVDGRVPVIFGLSDWDPTATALHDWLTGRLLRDHPHLSRTVPSGSTLAAALVDAGLILPVLDGFDEIAQGLRAEALKALNASSLPLVLTSRRGEFTEAVRAVHAPLVWAAGIELTALTPDDLAAYLPRATRTVTPGNGKGDRGAGGRKTASVWDAVLEALRTRETPASTNLAEVLTTPLMVVLARTMYSQTPDPSPAELLDFARFPTRTALEEHLLSGFVPAVYRRRAPRQCVPGHRRRQRNCGPERAEQWLGYLAHHLTRPGHGRQDLAWWQIGDCLRRPARVTAVVLATALCITTADWLVSPFFPLPDIGSTLLMAAFAGPVAGMAFGSIYAVLMSFRDWAAIEPARAVLRLLATHHREGRRLLPVFISRFGHGLLGGFLLGIGYACALALARKLYGGTPLTSPHAIESTLINMLLFGLLFGSAAGLAFGLVAALEMPLDVSTAATPATLLSSNRSTVARQTLLLAPFLTLTITLGGHLAAELLDGLLGPLQWGMWDGLLIGSVAGIGGGVSYALAFTAWGQWFLLSGIWLPLTGKLPWNTLAFLDDAHHRGVLRQTGAVYQFRHIRLQHHLADAYRHRST
ncbi:helix-turn-helix domain-containing protein [Streptomyces sp. MUM 2J]|nr:helix-turn-helix domain-containing protein [Streptomyces sp. MUM 2J]